MHLKWLKLSRRRNDVRAVKCYTVFRDVVCYNLKFFYYVNENSISTPTTLCERKVSTCLAYSAKNLVQNIGDDL